jgi:hypothetical protein
MGEAAQPQQTLDLASYVANLAAEVREEVFASSWTAQALFRALSPLAKQYILRLVYIDGGVPAGAAEPRSSIWIQAADQMFTDHCLVLFCSTAVQIGCSCGCDQQRRDSISEPCSNCSSCRCCRQTSGGECQGVLLLSALLLHGPSPDTPFLATAGTCSFTQTSRDAL